MRIAAVAVLMWSGVLVADASPVSSRGESFVIRRSHFCPMVTNGAGDVPFGNRVATADSKADYGNAGTRNSRTWDASHERPVHEVTAAAATPVRKREWTVGPDELAKALRTAPAGAVLNLLPGTYRGTFVLRQNVTLQGAGPGSTVVEADSEPVFIVTNTALAEVRGVTIRGGKNGIVVRGGRLDLHNAEILSGGVAIAAKHSVVGLRDVGVTCLGPEADAGRDHAVTLDQGQLTLANVAMTGRCARGVQATNSDIRIRGLFVAGVSRAAIHALDSLVEFDSMILDLERHSTVPAVFLARTVLIGTGLVVTGGEQGLLARSATLNVSGVRIQGAVRSGIALVGGNAQLANVSLEGPFIDGGVVATDAPGLSLESLRVTKAGQSGVLVIRTPLELRGGIISGATSDTEEQFGHGIMVQETVATLSDIDVSESDGAAIYAAGITRVEVEGAVARGTGAGMILSNRAQVSARKLTVNGGTPLGVFATERSEVHLDDSHLDSSSVGLMACLGATIQRSPSVVVDAPDRSANCWFGRQDWRRHLK